MKSDLSRFSATNLEIRRLLSCYRIVQYIKDKNENPLGNVGKRFGITHQGRPKTDEDAKDPSNII